MVNGKELFVQKCGSCHALKRAGTQGRQGPDLDQAFGPSRRNGLGEQTVAGVVERQIAHVRKNSTMPEDLVTGSDARDVAAYVAMVAGQTGKDTGVLANAGKREVSIKPIKASDGRLRIDADPTGALAFVTTKATATPGPLTVVSVNKASVPHNIALRNSNGTLLEEGADVSDGGTSKFSTTVKATKYSFVCTVPGHEEAGMKGELTVK